MPFLATAQPLRPRGVQKRWGFSTVNIGCTDKSIIAESGNGTARGLELRGSQWSLLLHAPLSPAYLNSQEAQGVEILLQRSRLNAVMAYMNPTQRKAVSQQPFTRTLLREPSSAANTPAFFPGAPILSLVRPGIDGVAFSGIQREAVSTHHLSYFRCKW